MTFRKMGILVERNREMDAEKPCGCVKVLGFVLDEGSTCVCLLY